MAGRDEITPETPESEGLEQPELVEEEIEGARLLANEARARLKADRFTDDEIDSWARTYYVLDADGHDEGDVDGLIAFMRSEQAHGREPAGDRSTSQLPSD